MSFNQLIDPYNLSENLHNKHWLIFDTRFDLADPDAGFKSYRKGHISGAQYVHLDNDLSSNITALTGRHPLPNLQNLVKKLSTWGITPASQIVIYDDACCSIAGRFWWLLRCLGHENVAVLDGGYKLWKQLNYPVTTVLPKTSPSHFRPYTDLSSLVSAPQVENRLANGTTKLIDARSTERFYGLNEPIDPIAGHIPKALNHPFTQNLDQNGKFLDKNTLKQKFQSLLGNTQAEDVIHMCGSGVTACHNLLAMEIAGLSGSKLFAGSWSEWIRNQNHPISTD